MQPRVRVPDLANDRARTRTAAATPRYPPAAIPVSQPEKTPHEVSIDWSATPGARRTSSMTAGRIGRTGERHRWLSARMPDAAARKIDVTNPKQRAPAA
jgi:hypothetical protein